MEDGPFQSSLAAISGSGKEGGLFEQIVVKFQVFRVPMIREYGIQRDRLRSREGFRGGDV